MTDLKNLIEKYFDNLDEYDPEEVDETLNTVLLLLNSGELSVTEKVGGEWIVNKWVKQAIILLFRTRKAKKMPDDYYDKIELLRFDYSNPRYRKVPGCFIRQGVFIGEEVVIMPSCINIGAHIGAQSMIDMNATIGSCAHIGQKCHIAANACIGGVLEPAGELPVIIEDNCFIGAMSSVLEGVLVEENSVIAPGVTISASTRIIERESGKQWFGRIPAGSVVVQGTYQTRESLSLNCAVIVKKIDDKTAQKTKITEILRGV
jgi:2,3,4,5-tetrahydropyridine-2-carboxylate N-succinyltransferase